MEALITILATVCPGIVSILGIIATILVAMHKIATIVAQFKSDKDKLIAQIAESDSNYKTYILSLIEQNKELTEANKLLTDHITHIKGYADSKLKGGE